MIYFNDDSVKLSDNELKEFELLKELHKQGVTKLKYAGYVNKYFSGYSVDEKGQETYICRISGITAQLIYDICNLNECVIEVDLTQLIRNLEIDKYISNSKKSVQQIVQELLQLGGETLNVQINPLKVSVQFDNGSCSNLSKEEAYALYDALKISVHQGITKFELYMILHRIVLQQLTSKCNMTC